MNNQYCKCRYSQRVQRLIETLVKQGAISGLYEYPDLLDNMSEYEFNELIHSIENSLYLIWRTDDVLLQLRGKYPLMNEADAYSILEYTINKHDATIGLSWDLFGVVADLLDFDKQHRKRMNDSFPTNLKVNSIEQLNGFMTEETWNNGRYEEFLASTVEDANTCEILMQMVHEEHLTDEYKRDPVFYYHSLIRYSKDEKIPALEALTSHLTAMFIRKHLLSAEKRNEL